MLWSKLKEQPIWSDIIRSSETPALSTCLSLHVSFCLSLRWDVVRGGDQSPDPHAGWTAFHRSAGIRSGSRLPDVRLLPRTAGTKWLFFLSVSQLLDSSQSAQDADCVSLLFQGLVLVSTASCFYSFICLFLNALMWSSTNHILMQIKEISTQILKFSLNLMKSIHI